ncbi:unnamed protein product [Arctogadus glacialis]
MWPGKGKSGAPCLSCSPRDPTPDKRMTMRMRMRVMHVLIFVLSYKTMEFKSAPLKKQYIRCSFNCPIPRFIVCIYRIHVFNNYIFFENRTLI